MTRRIGLAAAGWVVAGTVAMAGDGSTAVPQQTIVVTATRVAAPAATVGSSITIIDRAVLEQKQSATVADVLREAPGVDVVRSGGAGGPVSVFIRGAKSEQTLVLVDGVEINNPSDPGRGADLSQFPVDNIERIEVLRGPQSTLYGADAMGGVINIITRKGEGTPTGEITAEGGSFGTFNESAALRGGSSRVNYALGVSRQDAEGISSASEKNGNSEKDGYARTELSSRIGWTPTEEAEVSAILRWNRSNFDYDAFDFITGLPTDGDEHAEADRLLAYGEGKLALFDGLWRQRLGGSWVEHHRDDASSLSRSSFDSVLKKAEWQHDLYLGESHIVTAGLEYEEEAAKIVYEAPGYVERFDRKTARNKALYVQDAVTAGGLTATAGIRLDDHDAFGTEATWRVAPVYSIARTGTRIKGSYGTGFKAPSLFQLYSIYGSPALNPEKCRGWDAGVEQDLGSTSATVGITLFRSTFDDMIDYDAATFLYSNVAKAETSGMEAFVGFTPVTDLSLRVSYTYQDTLDKTADRPLVSRPRHKASLDAVYAFSSALRGSAGVTYVGGRQSWGSARTGLAPYTLVNLYAGYDVRKNVTVFGRVENLLDADYEEVLGYGTPGRAGYGGVKVTF